ncbi:MAG: amidohydrolase family protein [Gemmatimonadota bacterium]
MTHFRPACFPVLAALSLAAATAPLAAQDKPVAFRGARIIPISGAPIENGVVLVSGGHITAVGAASSVRIPSGATIIDATGKVIMPGLVDTHSHIGGGAGADASAPMQGDVRILDAIDAQADNFKRARAGGITTVNVMPGSGHLMSGQTVYLKLRDAHTIYDLMYCHDPLTEVCGGMKMANGTNPRGSPPWPGTRAKAAAIVREKFIKAREYKAKIAAAGSDSTKLPARDLEMEALVQVLDGKRVVHMHTHRHDDILTALRLQKEFGYRLVLHHVSEGWKVAKEIADAHVACSIIVIDSPGGKLEAAEMRLENAKMLTDAGVAVAFHTDDGITDSRFFIRSAALAVRAGLSREKALEGLTIEGARMLDLDKRIGTLETGKDADLLVLSGDPLSVYSHVEQTWVEGRKVFDRSDPKDRPFAVGGYKAMRDDQGFEDDDAPSGGEQ